MGRRFGRILKMKTARADAEKVLTSAIQRQYRSAWVQLARNLRRLKKQAGNEDWWTDWDQEWADAIDAALVAAVSILLSAEQDWFTDQGYVLIDIDPTTVINDYHLSGDLLSIPAKLRDRIEALINDFYADPDMTTDDLVLEIGARMTDRWAELTSITEIGLLAAAATLAAMFGYGVGRWQWDTMRDNKVCEFCIELDGRIFTIHDPMPPEASHDGCRCEATPVV